MAQLKITQVKSIIGRGKKQIATVKALGLKNIHDTVVKADNEQTRGMVNKVAHLVVCEEV